MPKSYLFFLLSLVILSPGKAGSQSLPPDTAIYLSAKNHFIQLYIDSAKENLRLYNGTEFTAAYRSSLGHPFFEQAGPQNGTIFYDGIFYPGVKLFYDIIRDEVIFFNEFKNLNVKLIPQKISWFTIGDHLFVRLLEDSSAVHLPGTGFYEQLYEGPVPVFKKNKKRLYEPSRADESAKYIQHDNYYVRKNNTYYAITGKRSLLSVCRDKKADLSKFIQKEGLNFKKDPDTMIVRVIDHYLKVKN